jgi:hypothetical protein
MNYNTCFYILKLVAVSGATLATSATNDSATLNSLDASRSAHGRLIK